MSGRFLKLPTPHRVLAVGLILSGAVAAVLLVGLTRGSGVDRPSEPPADCASLRDPGLDWGAGDGYQMIFVDAGGIGPYVSLEHMVRSFPVVAHVKVPADRSVKCDDRGEPGSSVPFIETSIRVEVVEYIKGDEGKNLELTFWGGTSNGYLTKVEGMASAGELPSGGEAVVVLSPGSDGVWFVADVYAFDGAIARSETSERELPVDQLLDELREAAKK